MSDNADSGCPSCKYSYEPAISCLGAVTFFRVSKLIRCPYQSQCNPASDRNPAKGKPKYSVNPVISCLEAVAFFRVSKLTYRGPERQCNSVRDRNPAKGKPLLRQGARMSTVHGRGYFFEQFNGSPRSFPGFCCGGNPGSGAQRRRTGRVPCCKGLRKQGAGACWKKKLPCDRF